MDNKEQNVYIAKHKDVNIRMQSRSGAFFVAVSDYILENGGSVYGCILDENLVARHIRAVDKDTRNKMCKTKYVQSTLGDTIQLIKRDLEAGMMVLFSGTGCQAAGVLGALRAMKAPLDLFYSIDIICHGAASPLLFKEYIETLKKKHSATIENFEFRDKTLRGWDEYVESYTVRGKKYPGRTWREIYHTDLCNRPSCYECPFCKVDRDTDITIGDAWGVKVVSPNFNDNRGVSLVIPHTKKGETLIGFIQKCMEIEKIPLEKMLQPNLQRPSVPKGNREDFWSEYRAGGINRLIKKYGTVSTKKVLYSNVKYLLRKVLQSKRYFLP